MRYDDLDLFTQAYLDAAAWSTCLESGEPIDSTEARWTRAALAQAKADCDAFRELAGDLLANMCPAQAGHDFWLTREGHGAGFWDRGLGALGDKLTALAHSFGSGGCYAYRGWIYLG